MDDESKTWNKMSLDEQQKFIGDVAGIAVAVVKEHLPSVGAQFFALLRAATRLYVDHHMTATDGNKKEAVAMTMITISGEIGEQLSMTFKAAALAVMNDRVDLI